jgi:Mrp family chromosome partitioning ATPase
MTRQSIRGPHQALQAAQPPNEENFRARSRRQRLRGRMGWLALTAVCGLVVGAAVGGWMGPIRYRRSGLIEVEARLEMDAAAHGALADQLLRAIRSSDTLENALAGEYWQAVPAADRPKSVTALARRITASRLDGSAAQILVNCTSSSPAAAAAAVRSILQVCETSAADQWSRQRLEQIELVKQRLASGRDRLAKTRTHLKQHLSGHTAASLEEARRSKLEQLNRYQSLLEATGRAIDASKQSATSDGEIAVRNARMLAILARADMPLQELLRQKHEQEQRMAFFRQRMGSNAAQVVELRRDMQATSRRIHEYVRDPDNPATVKNQDSGADGLPQLRISALELLARQASLGAAMKGVRAELVELDARHEQLESFDALAASQRVAVRQSSQRLDRLVSEPATSPVRALEHIEQPVAPEHDRRTLYAAALGVATSVIGSSIFLAVVLLDNRIRRPPDSAETDAPLLGVVPGVSPLDADPNQTDLAALAIHEVRAMLQVRAQADGAKAFAVTSPNRGAGTTSLTVGLASSLATSGSRTLLIDCDLAGRVVAPGAEAAGDNVPAATSADQVMLQMGLLDERDAAIFLTEGDDQGGLLGAIRGTALGRCVLKTNIPNLDILPALCADARDIATISSALVRQLIEGARASYDMILLDTGPVPGSVEALCVTSAADAVVVVVSRGELQSRFDRCQATLRMVGTPVAGTVFNRAAMSRHDARLAGGRAGRRGVAGPHRPQRELTAGSGILLAAVQVQSKPSHTASTSGEGATQQAAGAQPQGQPEHDAAWQASNLENLTANLDGETQSSAVEDDLNQQIRRLLAGDDENPETPEPAPSGSRHSSGSTA